MTLLFALNGASHLAVAVIAAIGLIILFSRGKVIRTIAALLCAIGIGHLLVGIMQILWVGGKLSPNGKDLVLLLLATTILSSCLLLYIAYKLTKNHHLIYVFIVYFVALIGSQFSMEAFIFLVFGISSLVLLLSFSEMLFFRNLLLRRAGILGIASTIVNTAFFAMLQNGVDPFVIPWAIPTLLIGASFFYILKDMKEIGVGVEAPKVIHHPMIHIATIFLKFLVFVFSITAFTFLSIVALHEFGHAIVGEYYGCEKHTAIIYDVSHRARTELVCEGPHNLFMITIAGFAITILMGIIFLIVGDNFTYRLSTLILGYSLLIAYGDFGDLGISSNLNAVLAILATIVVMLSIIRISAFYLHHYHLFNNDIRKNIEKMAKGEAQVERIATYQDEAKHINPLPASKGAKKSP